MGTNLSNKWFIAEFQNGYEDSQETIVLNRAPRPKKQKWGYRPIRTVHKD